MATPDTHMHDERWVVEVTLANILRGICQHCGQNVARDRVGGPWRRERGENVKEYGCPVLWLASRRPQLQGDEPGTVTQSPGRSKENKRYGNRDNA